MVTVLPGDCLAVLPTLPAGHFHSCVTDPPYGLTFRGAQWDRQVPGPEYWTEVRRVLRPGGFLLAFGGARTYHHLATAIEAAGFEVRDQIMWLYGSGLPKGGRNENLGFTLKPSHEPIVVARAPFKGSATRAAETHGTAMYRVGKPGERWPTNVVHDGSQEVEDVFALAGERKSGARAAGTYKGQGYGATNTAEMPALEASSGSASRFFYCAKASPAEREAADKHPTVKPLELMRYLVNLVTPPGGVVLDPFAGSGSTLVAASELGVDAVGIELESQYVDTICKRVDSSPRAV